jgi:branched-chain amino acid transport system substrate-binding protein
MNRETHLSILGKWTIAAAVWVAVWMAPSQALAASASRDVVIGAVLDLTGQGAARGRQARDALLLEEDRINESRPASRGRIRLVIIDTEGKTEAVSESVKKLAVEVRAAAVIGPAGRKASLAASREAERAGIPLISLSAPEALLSPPRRWVFSTAHPVSLSAGLSVSHIRAKGFRRAALLTSGSGLGREGREVLSAIAPERGISIVLNERFPPKEHNFLPYLQRAHLRGAEAFFFWSGGSTPLALARARLALDIRLPIFLAAVAARSRALENPGPAVEGLTFPAPRLLVLDLLPKGTSGLAAALGFRSRFRARFGQPPSGFAGYAADAVRIIERALEKGKSDEKGDSRRGSIRKSIETLPPYHGLTGTYRFSAKDHGGLRASSLTMVRIWKGKWALTGGKTR